MVVTKSADFFLERVKEYDAVAWEEFMQLVPQIIAVLRDEDEWNAWTRVGDPVLHIDVSRRGWLLLGSVTRPEAPSTASP